MSTDEAKYYRLPWMSDDQWYCAETWAMVMGGFHHCSDFKECGRGIEVSEYSSHFSTFDFDRLTRAVLIAHDRCVRLELSSSGPRMVKFRLHRRHTRDGSMSQRHPTIEQALETHRRHYPAPEVPRG